MEMDKVLANTGEEEEHQKEAKGLAVQASGFKNLLILLLPNEGVTIAFQIKCTLWGHCIIISY